MVNGTSALRSLLAWSSKLGAKLREWLIAPLPAALLAAIALTSVGAWIVAWKDGPEVYKIIVVSEQNGEKPDYSQMFWEGFVAKAPNPTKLSEKREAFTLSSVFRGITLEVDREFEAPIGDARNAQSVSSEIARSPDTLLVVLNLSSTRTKELLPEYLQRANPKIPVVLTATNPDILPPKPAEDYYPVLRMLPTDKQQIEAATDFLKDRKYECAFWVAEDTFTANRTYSHFLATEFVEEAVQRSLQVRLWSDSYSLLPADTLPNLGVNWVFFTGDWSDALILIRQLKAFSKSNKKNPLHIMLNETSMDQRLIDQGGEEVEGIYLTCPLPKNKWKSSDKGMTALGGETFQVVEQLLKASDPASADLAEELGGIPYKLRRLLGIHRVTDARNALISKMRIHDTKYKLAETTCEFDQEGTKYEYDANGDKLVAGFHLFQVKNKSFQPADEIASGKEPHHLARVPAPVESGPRADIIRQTALSQKGLGMRPSIVRASE